ncbi:MAG: TROVE domain-containing protein [Clostridia bacterium]|nr:TROVE domain-containing protein [Clostridia bacterium]
MRKRSRKMAEREAIVVRAFSNPAVERNPNALMDLPKDSQRNFMGGISYTVNPLDALKLISASSIFGEPQYYRDSDSCQATVLDDRYSIVPAFARYSLEALDPYQGKKTSQVMEQAIDAALDCDFGAVLEWALELRARYMMRLNPQVIMARAAMHPGRIAYTRTHPGHFAEIEAQVMARGDDVSNQLRYCLAMNSSKRGIPAILKRSWARRIGEMDAYTMAKYGNAGVGLVDAVRICHAKGPLVDVLMREGRVPMPEGQDTWERLRASGKGWKEILEEIRMPHMALLRNLRGIFSEVQDAEVRWAALEQLERGVKRGRQFPFRYLSAWKAVDETRQAWVNQVKRSLESCIDRACENLPALPGRCAFLTDNSGSAWGACTSEWGTMQVAEIGNLSAVIGGMRADEGVAFPFGDRLVSVPIHKDEGVLKQQRRVTASGRTCGPATENGIWLFFRDAIQERQHWDSIFIYSDMQAGHGGLFGINPEDYAALGCNIRGRYIDVNRLVQLYREQVNPKVNVYCIQTAGYTNALVPEYGYRTAILFGWTGRELVFADAVRRIWDDLEAREGQ